MLLFVLAFFINNTTIYTNTKIFCEPIHVGFTMEIIIQNQKKKELVKRKYQIESDFKKYQTRTKNNKIFKDFKKFIQKTGTELDMNQKITEKRHKLQLYI